MPRKKKMQEDLIETPPTGTDPQPQPTPTPDLPAPAGEPKSIFNPDGELVVDVFETHSDFVVVAAIAGVNIKDLDISVEKDMMVIKGQRPAPHEHPENKFVYQECYWGPFSRKIVLPENIDTQAADAQMDKGMLTIKIPKMEVGKENNNIEVS